MAESREYVLKFFVDVVQRLGKDVPTELKNEMLELQKTVGKSPEAFKRAQKVYIQAIDATKQGQLAGANWNNTYSRMINVASQVAQESLDSEEAIVSYGKAIEDIAKSQRGYYTKLDEFRQILGPTRAELIETETATSTLSDAGQRLVEQLNEEAQSLRETTIGTKVQNEELQKMPAKLAKTISGYRELEETGDIVPTFEYDLSPFEMMARSVANKIKGTQKELAVLRDDEETAVWLARQVKTAQSATKWYGELASKYEVNANWLQKMYHSYRNNIAAFDDAKTSGEGFEYLLQRLSEETEGPRELASYFWELNRAVSASKVPLEEAWSAVGPVRKPEIITDQTKMWERYQKDIKPTDVGEFKGLEKIKSFEYTPVWKKYQQDLQQFVDPKALSDVSEQYEQYFSDMVKAKEIRLAPVISEAEMPTVADFDIPTIDLPLKTTPQQVEELPKTISPPELPSFEIPVEFGFQPAQEAFDYFKDLQEDVQLGEVQPPDLTLLGKIKQKFVDMLSDVSGMTPSLGPFDKLFRKAIETVDKAAPKVANSMERALGKTVVPPTLFKKWQKPFETFFGEIVPQYPAGLGPYFQNMWEKQIYPHMDRIPTWKGKKAFFEKMLVPTGMPQKVIKGLSARTYFKGTKEVTTPEPTGPFKTPEMPKEGIQGIIAENEAYANTLRQVNDAKRRQAVMETLVATGQQDGVGAISDLNKKQIEMIKNYYAEENAINLNIESFRKYIDENKEALRLTEDQTLQLNEVAYALGKTWHKSQQSAVKDAERLTKRIDRLSSRVGFFGWVLIYTGRFVVTTLKQIWSAIDDVMKVGANWMKNVEQMVMTLALMKATGRDTSEVYGYLQDGMQGVIGEGLTMQTAYMELHSVFLTIQNALASMLVPAFQRFAEALVRISQTPAFQEMLARIVDLVETSLIPTLLDLLETVLANLPAFFSLGKMLMWVLGTVAKFAPILMTLGVVLWGIGPILKGITVLSYLYSKALAFVTTSHKTLGISATYAGQSMAVLGHTFEIAKVKALALTTAIVAAISVIALFAVNAMTASTGKISKTWSKMIKGMQKDTKTAIRSKLFEKWQGQNVITTKNALATIRETMADELDGFVATNESALMMTEEQWIQSMLVAEDATTGQIRYIDTLTDVVYNSVMDRIGYWNDEDQAVEDSSGNIVGYLEDIRDMASFDFDIDLDTTDLEDALGDVEAGIGDIGTAATAMKIVGIAGFAALGAKIGAIGGPIGIAVGAIIGGAAGALTQFWPEISAFWEDNVTPALEDAWERLGDKWENALEKWRSGFNTMKDSFNTARDIISSGGSTIGHAFGAMAASASMAGGRITSALVTSLSSVWEKLTGFGNFIGTTFNNSLNTLESSIATVGDAFESFKKLLAPIVNWIKSTVVDVVDKFTAALEALGGWVNNSASTLKDLGTALGNLCFVHAGPQAEQFSKTLKSVVGQTEEATAQVNGLSQSLRSVQGVEMNVGTQLGGSTDVTQNITVNMTIPIETIEAGVDWDEFHDVIVSAASEGIGKRLSRRRVL